jgi:hypothetical protein
MKDKEERTLPGYVKVPPSTTVQTTMSHKLRATLQAYAEAEGKTLSKYIAGVLEDHVKKGR